VKKSIYSQCDICPRKESLDFNLGTLKNTNSVKSCKILILLDEPQDTQKLDFLLKNSGLDKEPYFVTYTIMCTRDDHVKSDHIDACYIACKDSWESVKNKVKPRIILAFGQTVFDFLNISGEFDNILCNTIDYKKDKIIFFNDLNKKEDNKIFLKSLKTLKKLKELLKDNQEIVIQDKPTEIYSFVLPDWCYDKDHVLIDIQHDKSKKEVIYIFKNVKTDDTVYHYESSNNNYFYTFEEKPEDADLILSVEKSKLRFDSKGLSKTNVTKYESDINITLKHSIDYYYMRNKLNSPEPLYSPKVLYWDIEVYNEGDKKFPFASKAEKPINSISFKVDDTVYVYLYKHPDMDKSDINYEQSADFKTIHKVFDSESDLIINFCEFVKQSKVCILAAWNGFFFDMPYIFNRMTKLGISHDTFSPLDRSYVISKESEFNIFGLYFVDQLFLYKKTVQGNEINYKLSTIAQKYLGKDKIAYEGTLDDIYQHDINKFMEYSATDTNLLWELEERLGHIALRFELIKLSSSTWKRAESSMGTAEPLLCAYAKNKNLICRDKLKSKGFEVSGAYVLPTIAGIHKWVVDFDFKSLYPSIMCSLNLGNDTYVAKINSYDAIDYLYNRDDMNKTVLIKLNPTKHKSRFTSISKEEFIKLMEDNGYIIAINGCIFESHDKKLSFLSQILKDLIDRRDIYKNKAKEIQDEINKSKTDSEKEELLLKRKKYDIIQVALKIKVNSIYGSLLNKYFRFYNHELGEAVTSTGQEAIKFCIHHLNNYLNDGNLEIDQDYLTDFEINRNKYKWIITSDTDSLYINLGDYLSRKGKL
jgi:DNA polymerase elongation subunit (family B)